MYFFYLLLHILQYIKGQPFGLMVKISTTTLRGNSQPGRSSRRFHGVGSSGLLEMG